MSQIKKKSPKSSASDLLLALNNLIDLLESQKEAEAVEDLRKIRDQISTLSPENDRFQKGLEQIKEAFTGDHELEAYTIRRESSGQQWSVAEDLYIASTNVWSLLNRLKKN